MSWDELKQIAEANARFKEAEEKAEVIRCPQCAYLPLKTNAAGDKACPICGWTNK